MKLLAAWSVSVYGHPQQAPNASRSSVSQCLMGRPQALEELALPYLVVQSRGTRGGQGQPVTRVGGGGRGLPGARCVLASWQVLLPWVHLKYERGECPWRDRHQASSAPIGRPVLAHADLDLPVALGGAQGEAPTLTSLE